MTPRTLSRQAGVAGLAGGKTGSVLDGPGQRRRIPAAALPGALHAVGLVHRFGEQELRAAQAHAHGTIDKAPLILLLNLDSHNRWLERWGSLASPQDASRVGPIPEGCRRAPRSSTPG